MKKKGTIKSDSSIFVTPNRAIIEIDDGDNGNHFYFERKSISQFNISNSENETIITSTSESKSLIKKILGGGGVIFYKDKLEVCRITELNKNIIYNSKEYTLDITKNSEFWKFSTHEFCIETQKGFDKLYFSFEEKFLLPCLACSVYIWSTYMNQLS